MMDVQEENMLYSRWKHLDEAFTHYYLFASRFDMLSCSELRRGG